MRTLISMVAILFIGTGAGFGAFSDKDAGTSASQFLKLGAGARAAGMGEAFAGVADDATAVYWNPAGLNMVKGNAVSAMHAAWFEDITYDWFSFVHARESGGTWGAGIQYLSYGSIKEMDDAGIERGAFTPSDMAVSLSYAEVLNEVMVGGNVKYVSSKIRATAQALALDLGVMVSFFKEQKKGYADRPMNTHRRSRYESPSRAAGYQVIPGEYPASSLQGRLTAGMVVQNLGSTMKFESEDDPLPLSLKFGAACKLRSGWVAALDITAPVDNEIVFGFGTEYGVRLNERAGVTGRVGYSTRARDTGGLNGISAGFGFSFLNYGVDYAFVPYGDLGNTHRISFSFTL